MNENEFNSQIQQKQNEIDNLNNILNNERQNYSAQIQQKQNEIDQIRISFDGERNNYNSQIQQKQNEIDNLNNILNNERQNYSAQIQQKQNEIDNLNNVLNNERQSNSTQIQQKQNEIDQVRISFDTERNNLNSQLQAKDAEKVILIGEKNSLSNEILNKDGEIRDLREENNIRQKELESVRDSKNSEIIKNLSAEYEKISECELKNDKDKWLSKVNIAFVAMILIVIATLLVFLFWEIDVLKKIPILTLDLVGVSFLWFCINQYSYYSRLYTEYTNRKIVSKSFLGVLNNIKDAKVIDESTKTIVNTLFSRSSTEIGSELPIKEMVKIAANIASKNKE